MPTDPLADANRPAAPAAVKIAAHEAIVSGLEAVAASDVLGPAHARRRELAGRTTWTAHSSSTT